MQLKTIFGGNPITNGFFGTMVKIVAYEIGGWGFSSPLPWHILFGCFNIYNHRL
jgi:hypothetical protein